jgi:DNA-binding MarR family transcriptional regulator
MATKRNPTPTDVSLLFGLSRALVGVAVRSLRTVDNDLPLPQLRALTVLERYGPCSAGGLADAIGLHVSSTTRLCDRLVARGLITRQTRPDNRREVELAISPTGSGLVHEVWAARAAELSTALRSLQPAQRASLRDVIPPLLAILGDPEDLNAESAWG